MIKKFIPIILLMLVVFITGCQSCRNRGCDGTSIHIAALNTAGAAYKGGAIRLKFLTETATLIGAQGGLAYRSEQINCVLKRQQDQLDKVYNFRALLLKDDIVPPVLEEGRQDLNLDSCNAIRLADQIIKIVSPPCFVTAPPNWRDYIWMTFCQPEQPDATLLPKCTEEAAIWNCYVQKGWEQGVNQANQIFGENLSRLKRDYNGMLLYRKLLAQNMVTPPYVTKTELGITHVDSDIDGKETMRINDKVLTISATSRLNPNSDSWRAVVAKSRPDDVCRPIRENPGRKCTTIIRN